jgi:hypothetical protein
MTGTIYTSEWGYLAPLSKEVYIVSHIACCCGLLHTLLARWSCQFLHHQAQCRSWMVIMVSKNKSGKFGSHIHASSVVVGCEYPREYIAFSCMVEYVPTA